MLVDTIVSCAMRLSIVELYGNGIDIDISSTKKENEEVEEFLCHVVYDLRSGPYSFVD